MYPSRVFPQFSCPARIGRAFLLVPNSALKAGLLPAFWQERLAGRFDGLNPRFGRHKILKSRPLGLSKAGLRWYIPLAPNGVRPGCLLRKPPDRFDRRPQALDQIRSGIGFRQGVQRFIAGWSSPVARQAHNLKVIGSNPIPATSQQALENIPFSRAFCCPNFGSKIRSWKRQKERRSVRSTAWTQTNDSIIVIGGPLRAPPLTP